MLDPGEGALGANGSGTAEAVLADVYKRQGKEWVEINLKDEGSYILAQETRKEAEDR